MKSLELSTPHLIVVVGLPGTGKTYFAKQFAEMFQAPYVDYSYYQQLVGNEHTGDVVATEIISQLVITKQTIVVEGRGETKQDRALLANMATQKGYEVLYVWVQTEPMTAKQRALKINGISEQDFAYRSQTFTPLDRIEPQQVISGKHTFASQAKMVLKKLVSPRAATNIAPAAPRPQRQAAQPAPTRNAPQKRSGRIIIG